MDAAVGKVGILFPETLFSFCHLRGPVGMVLSPFYDANTQLTVFNVSEMSSIDHLSGCAADNNGDNPYLPNTIRGAGDSPWAKFRA